ncbi:MAG: RNA 2',3'-cyclic phosphodiesterase, partial [Promethearchaeota archaeon]
MKQVEPANLHMTVKFLGNIPETMAPRIYKILKEEINDKLFKENYQYRMEGAGHFRKFSVIWIKLVGDIPYLQKIKDNVETLLKRQLNIEEDERKEFKPHLTIGRLKSNRIDSKNFNAFKKLINENKDLDFGAFNINQIKLKKSILTPKGPIYYNYKENGFNE